MGCPCLYNGFTMLLAKVAPEENLITLTYLCLTRMGDDPRGSRKKGRRRS